MNRLFVALFWTALVFAFVMAVLPVPPNLPASDKIQHAAAFAVLALLARFAYPGVAGWKLLVAIVGFGGLIELVQATPWVGRDGDAGDWMVDAAAALFVLAVTTRLIAGRKGREVSA